MTDQQPTARTAQGWVTLDDLDPGSLFETTSGSLAVKSEYHYPSHPYDPHAQWECVLLRSGEFGHFKDKNRTLVREIDLTRLQADLEHAREERDNALDAEKLALRLIGADLEHARAEVQRVKENHVTIAEEIERRRAAVRPYLAVVEAAREMSYEGHRDACKISVGRCNCGYLDLADALTRLDAANG